MSDTLRASCLAILILSGPALAADVPAPAVKSAGDSKDEARRLAERIDAKIAAHWAEAKAVPAAVADDAEFLRRASLDIVGHIPAASEVRDFLDDPSPDKRVKAVDRLLDSPGYAAHMTNIYKHLLVPEADTDYLVKFYIGDFEPWLRRQFAENAGFDKVVRELLTTSINGGPNPFLGITGNDPKPTPFGYYMAKGGKPEALAAATARTFLGVRLECAQCHDHPYAKWKRDQFWGYASFFGGVENVGMGDCFPGLVREVPDRRELAIPNSDKVVQAAFLDGAEPHWSKKAGTRQALADWATAKGNPYFAKAAVNRAWSQFFGVGIVDPVDDMGDDNVPSHPEVLEELSREFAAHDFDLKFLIRTLTATRAYNLTSAGGSPGHDDPRLFARMSIRGMSAEQVYESLALATGFRDASPPGNNAFLGDTNTARGMFLEKFKAEEEKAIESQTSILQALTLMNGKIIAEATGQKKGRTLVAVAEAPFLDTAAKVESLYFAALSRKPTPEESARMVAYVDRGGSMNDKKKALGDVFWALLNGGEFLLNH